MRRPNIFAGMIVLMLVVLSFEAATMADHFYWNAGRRNSGCNIRSYRYGHENVRRRVVVLSLADPVVPANLVGTDYVKNATMKRFHIPVSALEIDQVRLEKIGLVMYSTGEVIGTGMLHHTGGPDGALLGNHVQIRVRAYAGVPKVANVADAVVVWQDSREVWVSRNRPELVRFAKASNNDVKQFFQTITHVELELSYTQDR